MSIKKSLGNLYRNITGKDTDIIDIYEYVYFKDGTNYYSDYNKTNLLLTSSEDVDLIDTNKDDVGMYRYRFIKNNNIYAFYSVEKVK